MKRLVSIILVAALIFCLASTAFAAKDFSDIQGDEALKTAAVFLSEANIFNGFSDGTFRPEDEITRAQLMTVICRMSGLENAALNFKEDSVFKDVPNSHWAVGYVMVAYKKAISKGYGDGTFRPNNSVSANEAIKVIVNAAGFGDDVKKEQFDPADWAGPYLKAASDNGLLDNVKAGGNNPITRRDVAVMVYNAMKANGNVSGLKVEEELVIK